MTGRRESGSAANAVPGHSEPPTWPRAALERRLAVRAALGLALAATVLLLVWRLADWSQIGPAVRVLGTRPELLVVFLAGYTLAFGLRAFAWRQLIVSGGGVFSLFAILQAALLANHLLPFKLGEVARPALATRRGIPAGQAAASTAVARLLDFASLVAIASLAVLLLAPDGRMAWMQSLALRGTAKGDRQASRFEILAARAWNVLNEGKPFTPVFVVGLIFLISLAHLTDTGYWARAGLALVALLPMFICSTASTFRCGCEPRCGCTWPSSSPHFDSSTSSPSP